MDRQDDSLYFAPKVPTRSGTFDVERIRKDFPLLSRKVRGKPLIWLDNAATSQKPFCVIDKLKKYYEEYNSNVHRGAHDLAAEATDAYEGARRKVRDFIGARSVNEIVFVRGATEAVNLVAQTYGRQNIGPGDEILITELEHHANIVPWQMICKEKGALLKVAPINDAGEIILEEFAALLGPKTRIVGIGHVSNALGTVNPVAEMIEMAHSHGAVVLLDGAQSVPHMRVNVAELDCDFFAFSGHKIFAPTGIGVLYGKEELLKSMPPWQGGGSMIKRVTKENATYQDPPHKFEAGTGNIADAVGLGAALDYLHNIGFEQAAAHEEELLQYATAKLSPIPGVRLIGTARKKVGVISLLIDGHSVEDVGKRLNEEGIAVRASHHCAQLVMQRFGTEATVRPSFAFYNTFEEVDKLAETIKKIAEEGQNA
ncbi:cysteine desulfurase [Candidatus Woesearchaeota archaeon]|nr:cysteine desulfurase [Candidatus Woesearchaeota archaeon]